MAASTTSPWKLENFLDSLILELDKAQDTLAVKGLTRRMTYTLGEMNVDLNVFPSFQDGKVKFQLARPGESGSSRLSFQLGSITDRQIREVANEPISREDIGIDGIEGLDEEVRESLRKVGVKSAQDFERLERRNVAVDKVVEEKTGSGRIDYAQLANVINRARRRKLSPGLSVARGVAEGDDLRLTLSGRNFVLAGQKDGRFPVALLNDLPVRVAHADDNRLELLVPRAGLAPGANRLRVALDPYAVIELSVRTPEAAP